VSSERYRGLPCVAQARIAAGDEATHGASEPGVRLGREAPGCKFRSEGLTLSGRCEAPNARGA